MRKDEDMSEKRRLTDKQIENLANEIYRLLHINGLWSGASIYFNGCCMDNVDDSKTVHYDGSAYVHPDIDPSDRFVYVNPDHVLSMSFEGCVYQMFNYTAYPDVLRKFTELLKSYGLYYELGNAWNLTCYYG